MSERRLWGFDIDSVVGNLSAILERVAWEEFGLRVSSKQFTDFHLDRCLPFDKEFIIRWISRALEPEWTLRMEPYPEAVDVLKGLALRQPLLFVTARPEKTVIREWLVRRLHCVAQERIKIEAVGAFNTKVPVLKEWGVTHFVEDRLETCVLLAENGIVPVVFEQPWNSGRHSFPRVKDWRELKRLISEAENGDASWPKP